MKPFSLLKIPVLLLGFGALLVFTPTCKAQSEINPDHFDGTDSWERATQKPVLSIGKHAPILASAQSQDKKPGSTPTFQLATARDSAKPTREDAVVLQDKRKAAGRKPKNQK
jgi:hypothetical protein